MIGNIACLGLSLTSVVMCARHPKGLLQGRNGIISVGLLAGTSVNVISNLFLKENLPINATVKQRDKARFRVKTRAITLGVLATILTSLALTVRVVYKSYS